MSIKDLKYHPTNIALMHYRNEQSLSQRDLGDKTGISFRSISKFELGLRKNPLDLNLLAEALTIDVSHLQTLDITINPNLGFITLSVKFPDIFKELHPRKNTDLNLKRLSYGSSKKVWWQCGTCSGDWQTTVNQRTSSSKSACPHGSIKPVSSRVPLENSYPCISKEYHPSLNIKPLINIYPNDRKKRWWLCGTCTHEWQNTPFERTKRDKYKECPNCLAERLIKPVNEAIKEFGGTLISYEIEDNYNQTFHIICKKGHPFTIDSETAERLSWCKVCGQGHSAVSTTKTAALDRLKNALLPFGFQLLANRYLGFNSYHEVKCNNGHPNRISPNSLYSDKVKDPICSICSRFKVKGVSEQINRNRWKMSHPVENSKPLQLDFKSESEAVLAKLQHCWADGITPWMELHESIHLISKDLTIGMSDHIAKGIVVQILISFTGEIISKNVAYNDATSRIKAINALKKWKKLTVLRIIRRAGEEYDIKPDELKVLNYKSDMQNIN
jgi:transcriptional regulator with XRE-family HTH domain/DNA-directed RNA polymerase subunit RPC12/RpoP